MKIFAVLIALLALVPVAAPVAAQDARLELQLIAVDKGMFIDACNPCEEMCPDTPYVRCIADYTKFIADCFKPGGPCTVHFKVDPWTLDDLTIGTFYGAPAPVLSAAYEAITADYDAAAAGIHFKGISDFCARAYFVNGEVPPECSGQIGQVILQHAVFDIP